MKVVRRALVLPGHVELGSNGRKLVNEFEMKSLAREDDMSVYTQTQLKRRETGEEHGAAYHVSHSFGFDTTSHTTRRPRSLDLAFVAFREIPDRVVGVAENPEVISADVGEFLKVRLVYPRLV